MELQGREDNNRIGGGRGCPGEDVLYLFKEVGGERLLQKGLCLSWVLKEE